MDTLIKVAQFFLSLSLLIVLHEWGHYFFARLFKTRVNKFYLFFDFLFPVPTLLNFSLWKKKKGDTEFGLGWFPFGGYVQIDGMMDETQDAEKLKSPPQPWEFRSKTPWQRLFIMLGGIIVNVLTAFIIYSMVLFVWGETRVVNSTVKHGITVGDSLMYNIGFKDGDRIKTVQGQPVEYFEDVVKKMIIKGEKTTVVVDRNGTDVSLTIPVDIIGQLSSKKINKKGLFLYRLPTVVDSFDVKDINKSNAIKAGIKFGDEIIRIDSTPVKYFDELVSYVEKQKAAAVLNVTVLRKGQELSYKVQLDSNKKLGIPPVMRKTDLGKMGWFQVYKKDYGFFESIPAGISLSIDKLSEYIDQFALLFKPSTGAYKGMGGFASMTQIFSTSWDWESFWNITAYFSIVLAFMNFLPIPMLDGGYILFTLFEIITGKKVPDKFLEKANMVGFVIIIGLMVFTNGNDIFRKIMGRF